MEETPFDVEALFQSTMKKKWDEVLTAYQNIPAARKAKLTKSEDTALHIAISSYRADLEDAIQPEKWVKKLVDTFPDDKAVEILGMPNDKGNTPLHFAAALGSEEICRCIASKDKKLMEKRNRNSETPFFLAADHGKLGAFLCLHEVWGQSTREEPDESLFRRKDGCNILHAAISGEYFKLAYQIILKYKKLVDRKNEEGLSPLHILAMKPSVFQSSSNLRLCDRIIYRCLTVPKINGKDFGTESYKNNFCRKSNKRCPDNYETCMNLMQLLRSVFKIIVGKHNPYYCFREFLLPASTGTRSGSQNDEQHRKDEESQDIHSTETPPDAGGNNARKSINDRMPDEHQNSEDDEYERSFPPNYDTCMDLFKFALNFMLVILGIGFSRIKKIREKKEKHTWACRIMNKLMEHEKDYKYGHNGQSPTKNLEPQYAATFAPPDVPFETDEHGNPSTEANNKSKNNEERDEDKPVVEDRCVVVTAKMKDSQTAEKLHSVLPDAIEKLEPQQSFVLFRYQKKKIPTVRKETPILVAAKMGITEMVDKILETFPVAIQDVDEHEKNALLLAVENRQTKVYDSLMKKKLPEFVLYQVDDEGNCALHLAATFQQHPPWRIPGAALQMQWEIKWYKHVKHTMPARYLVHFQKNITGETARQIFTRTHEKLLKNGSEWLIKTSESCSVVAALIAGVSFATAATVPGGVDDKTGDPVLEGHPAFDAFSITSLVALCFSVTALVFFLAILTSRCQEKDFRKDLPRKLLLGLSFLFMSIAAILFSFCAGHFFVLKDELHNASLVIYTITCLPITFYAFAQLPLYFDLLWSIFRKVPVRSYKVFTQ